MEPQATMSPQSPQPNSAPPPSFKQVKAKVTANPFKHIAFGVSSFFKTNLSSGLLAVLLGAVATSVFMIGLLYAIFQLTKTVSGGLLATHVNASDLIKGFGILFGVILLGLLILGYFSAVLNRIIITGARKQKESLGHAMSFAAGRYPKIIATYLTIFGIVIGVEVLLLVLARVIGPIVVLLFVAAIIVGIVFALRIIYTNLVLVDDHELGGPISVMKRSSALWKVSGGAIIVYALLMFIIAIILNIAFSGLTGTTKHQATYQYPLNSTSTLDSSSTFTQADLDKLQAQIAKPATFTFAFVGVIIYAFIYNCFGALAFMGQASIYNSAQAIIDGPGLSVGSAPPPPPMPEPAGVVPGPQPVVSPEPPVSNQPPTNPIPPSAPPPSQPV
ncbi:MAG TPA: hypothetical protein VLF87_00440 [Patescibacteria group bacterium]|nr:hypothetical protein [Patescibacteria group bacterium]